MGKMTIQQFGRHLKTLASLPEVESLAKGGWEFGGCWTLAEAVKKFIGPKAKLYAIRSDGVNIQHVVVKYGTFYIDFNGAQTKAQLMKNIDQSFEDPELVPFTEWDKRNADAMCLRADRQVVHRLVEILREYFGF
jgi:hypothetical protein